jgi:hypothetical protein
MINRQGHHAQQTRNIHNGATSCIHIWNADCNAHSCNERKIGQIIKWKLYTYSNQFELLPGYRVVRTYIEYWSWS